MAFGRVFRTEAYVGLAAFAVFVNVVGDGIWACGGVVGS